MANTTNFNWETPDDTDLVKDGAAAIRTLAGAIDTSLVDLKGGTTDQVLAKNSGTDMDFKWVADASGIPATIFDAKGDIIAASAADTAARLAVGANNTVLTADSSTSTGLKWATPTAGGFTLLSTTTFSGAAVNLTSISGSYKHLYLQWYGLTNATANGYLDIRLNNNTGSVYNCFRNGSGGATTFAQAENAATFLRSSADNLLRTDSNNAGNMFIYNYTSSTNRKLVEVQMAFVGPTNNNVHLTNCLFLSNTAVTEVNFFLDNAASFSTGTVELYGVN